MLSPVYPRSTRNEKSLLSGADFYLARLVMLSRPPFVIARGWRRRPPGLTSLGTPSRDNGPDRLDWRLVAARPPPLPAQAARGLPLRPPNDAKLIPAGSDRPPLPRQARHGRSDIRADCVRWSPYRQPKAAGAQRHRVQSAR